MAPPTPSNINQGRQVHHVAPKSSIIVSEDTDISADYDQEFPVDPALLEERKTLSQVVGGITDLALITGIEDAISDALAPKPDPVRLEASSADFVRQLSKINIVKNMHLLTISTESRELGMASHSKRNSKDSSTHFTFTCSNAHLGCDYTTAHEYYLEKSHSVSCILAPGRETLKVKQTKTEDQNFKCSQEDCNSSFRTQDRLIKHTKLVHQA